MNRLTSAQNAGTDCSEVLPDGHTKYWGNSYGYDPWGNLINKTITKCGAEHLEAQALANNQLADYGYDAAGNMTQDLTSGMQYHYDAGNMLKTVGSITYWYDNDGQRYIKWNNGVPVKSYFYGSDGEILAEGSGGSILTAEYIFFNGKRIARVDLPGNSVHYYLSDHLGSTSMVVSSAGAIEEESDYSPFGSEYVVSGAGANAYKFTGKERDSESQLNNFGARYYSGAMGRFITPDQPFGDEDEGDPQSWNLYAYAGNNPVRYIDPTGQAHTDSNGTFVGDFNGEKYCGFASGQCLYWSSTSEQWDKNAPMNTGEVNPGFLGPLDIFFFGRLPGGSAANAAEETAAKIAAENAARMAAEAAAKAAAEAALKKEVAELIGKAASTVGNQGIRASSRQAAEQAAREWVGAGAKSIRAARGTGQIIGEISADGQRVARFTSANKAAPYINLENKATGGNLHVRF